MTDVQRRGDRRRSRVTPAERRARNAAVDDPATVLDAALRFLEARQRSEAEVRRRLTEHGYRSDLVDGAITRLTELGILDDAAFAAAWVASRDRAHPRGERALRRELVLKGLERSVIDAAMEDRRGTGSDAADDVDEAAARRLIERNAAALRRIADPRSRRQRAYALLARHGFDPDVAGRVARELAEPATDDLDAEAE